MSAILRKTLTFTAVADGVTVEQEITKLPGVGFVRQMSAVMTAGAATTLDVELLRVSGGTGLDSLVLWQGAVGVNTPRMDVVDIDKYYHDAPGYDGILYVAITPHGGVATVAFEVFIES